MIGENSSLISILIGGVLTLLGIIIAPLIKSHLDKVKARDDAQYRAENVRLEGGWAKYADDLWKRMTYLELAVNNCETRERACNERVDAQSITIREMEERLRKIEGQGSRS